VQSARGAAISGLQCLELPSAQRTLSCLPSLQGISWLVSGWTTRQSTSFSTSWLVYRCSSSRLWEILQFLIGIGRGTTNTTLCVEGLRRIFEDKMLIVIYPGHCFLLQAKFKRWVLSDLKIKRNSVSTTVSIDLMLVSTSSSSGISPYLCLPPLVRSVHFGVDTSWWWIIVQAMLRGIYKMPDRGCRINHLMLLMMSQLQYLIGSWWLSFLVKSSKVCSSHSPRAWSSGMLAMRFWMPSQFLKLQKCRAVFFSVRMFS